VNYRPTLWESERSALAAIEAALPLADILKLNEQELGKLAEAEDLQEACLAVVRRGPALCVATLGPQGCAYATRSTGGRVPGFRVKTVDATGCGDAFMGALLARIAGVLGDEKPSFRRRLNSLSSAALSEALSYANAAGALTATKKGVIPALPSAAQVERFLSKAGAVGQ
jgi:fructokinase